MCPTITVLDSTTNPGSADRVNEDTYGANDHCAFVIDGATGLGDRQYMGRKNDAADHGSDAAWLAAHAARYFEENIGHETHLEKCIDALIDDARTAFNACTAGETVEKYACPVASFAMVHLYENKAWFSGLGDCTLYMQSANTTQTLSPLAKFQGIETANAARHLQRTGGFGARANLLSDPKTLADLRTIRGLQNSNESGVWTLGLEPLAAQHIFSGPLNLTATHHAIVCSDGFSALVTDYSCYTPQTLVTAALEKGLSKLVEELRHVERNEDPKGLKYPRFKMSDDATAILLSIAV